MLQISLEKISANPSCRIQAHLKSQLVEGSFCWISRMIRYRMYVYRLPFSPEQQDAPYSCTARVHPMARFDGEVQFIAIRVLMQPRSLLVNRQLFNKYFHSHHYYLGGSPKIAHVRVGRGEGCEQRIRLHEYPRPCESIFQLYIPEIPPPCSSLVFLTHSTGTAKNHQYLQISIYIFFLELRETKENTYCRRKAEWKRRKNFKNKENLMRRGVLCSSGEEERRGNDERKLYKIFTSTWTTNL